ncbi:type I-G CRISPR-associated helicase/endonuclease Cas3g [Lipingzhangella halophila]|nr:type I-U CRISPR-associated helicase/endonuclease Cas3 [Lipingzhangella halophila]
MLDVDAFTRFYTAIHSHEPFPWQQSLLQRVLDGQEWPDAVDVPTALGKTSVLDIAVFAAAAGAPAARRRVFFVVDRRLVVDEAYDHAQRLAHALAHADQYPEPVVGTVAHRLHLPHDAHDQSPVDVTRMRGGTTWSWRWLDRPDRHAIVVGTVDQIGSRLLMRGYGTSPNLRPIDAALVGTDSLILLDEAHLSQALLETVRTLTTEEEDDPLARPRLMALSATVPLDDTAQVHATSRADEEHPIGRARLRTPRRVHLVEPKTNKVVVDQLAGWSRGLARDGEVVLTVCNTVAHARAVFDALAAQGVAEEDRVLLTGKIRPVDRDHLIATYYPRMRLGRTPDPGQGAMHVVATQTVEVGANIDADVLVSESASLTALTQRLGRLARAAELRPSDRVWVARAVIVHDPKTDDDDPVYGPARNATWQVLSRECEVLYPTGRARFTCDALPQSRPASPLALRDLLASLSSEDRDRVREPYRAPPVLWPHTWQAWQRTSPTPVPDPPVAPYLHGRETGGGDVQLVWRDDVTNDNLDGVGAETLRVVPPAAAEMLQLSVSAFRYWAHQQPDAAGNVADVEGTTTDDDANGNTLQVLRYRGRDGIEAVTAADVRPGDVVVVPAGRGGYDRFGWAPHSTVPVVDVADVAPRRDQPLVRLHPRLCGLAPDLSDELHTLMAATSVADEDQDAEPLAEDYVPHLKAFLAAGEHTGVVTHQEALHANLQRLAAASSRKQLVAHRLVEDDETPRVVLSTRGGGYVSDEDEVSTSTGEVTRDLEQHQREVARQAAEFARNLDLDPRLVRAVWLAARHHDQGKRDPRFQFMLRGTAAPGLDDTPALAKSTLAPGDRTAYRQALVTSGYPRGMRHEALSAQLATTHLERNFYDVDTELVVHLIAAHHGRNRPLLPAVTDPNPHTVTLPGGETATTNETHDWKAPQRFARLTETYGPWRLALLETIVRLADIWCSANQPLTPPHEETPTIPAPSVQGGVAAVHTVALPALDGRDPLGFLTTLGVLRLLTNEGHPAWLSFDPTTATAHLTSPMENVDAIVEALTSIIHAVPDGGLLPEVDPSWPPQIGIGKDPIRVPPDELPAAAEEARKAGAQDWLGVIITDLARRNADQVTPYMAPAGGQKVATFFKKPFDEVRSNPDWIRQALTSWRRLGGFTGENLDHRVIRTAGDTPTGKSTPSGVPGATWLATQASPLLRLTGTGTRSMATMWHRIGRRRVMVWPIWRQPLDLWAIQALLEHPQLRPHGLDEPPGLGVDRSGVAPLGVVTVGAAERRPIPGGKSAGVLAPTPIRLT